MNTKNKSEIFKRFYAGIQSLHDEKQLLNSEPVNTMMKDQWENPGEMKDKLSTPDFDAIFSKIETRAYAETKVRRFPVYKLVAGIALLIGVTAALYFLFAKNTSGQQIQYSTASGEVKSFTLPDGSLLWLGENSHVSFTSGFGDNRVITMEGLAFYKVVKNNTPFKVNTGTLSIEVTGTQFSVSNYANAPDIQATLVEGSINITDSKGELIKELKPNDKFSFHKASHSFQVNRVHARELTLWKESKLVFNNTPMSEIADRLSKRYGVSIRVEKQAEAYNFTFSCSDEPLDEILALISSLAPVKAIQNNDSIVFTTSK